MTKEDSSHDDSSSLYASEKMPSYKFFDSNLNYSFYTESDATPPVMAAPAPLVMPAPIPPVMPENLSKGESLLQQGTALNDQPAWSPRSPSTPKPDSDSQDSELAFSAKFDFNESLLKIFWRIDIDRNNRVNKAELQNAIGQNWFDGDEQILAAVLLSFYDELVCAPVFCDVGLSVNQILSSPLFSEMSTKESDFYQPYGGCKKTKTKTNSFKMMLSRR